MAKWRVSFSRGGTYSETRSPRHDSGAAEQIENRRPRKIGGFYLLEFEFFSPGDYGAPDELVHQHDHPDHAQQAGNDGTSVAVVGGGLQVGTKAGQTQVPIAEDEHLAGHQKKPAAGDGHHRVPHQADGGIGQFHLDEALPPTPAVNFRGFLHLARNVFERGVETEGHVPNLAGKNQKDRTELDAQLARWKQGNHGHHYRRKKTEDRDGLQGVQKREHVALGAGVVSGDVTVDEGEGQAEHIRNGDAQDGKHRVLRQHPRAQADFGALGDRSHPVVGEREQRVEKREAR